MFYKIDGRLVKNFTLAEMCNKQAKDDVKLILTTDLVKHAQMIQELRDWYNKPLNVSSWYRTPSFNKSCGGSSNSCHLDGTATDINNIPQSDYDKVKIAWEIICNRNNTIGGVNFYDTFIHFCSTEDKFVNTEFIVRDYRGKKGND